MSQKIPMIGQILVREKLVTEKQVSDALGRQSTLKAEGRVVPIGQLLIEMGLVSENQIRIALRIQQEISVLRSEADKLGMRLLEANMITPTQLQVALADHRATGIRVGEALVARGYVTEEGLETFLRSMVQQGTR